MAVNRDFTKNYNLQGGELYIKLSNETNFRYFGQTNEFKLNFKSTKLEHKNSEGNTIVTDMEVTKEVESNVSFTTDDLNKETLAIAFSGTATVVSQSAGSITDEVIAGVAGGLVYELSKNKVSNVIVKDSDDNEYEENVDYSINYIFGTIEITTGGALDSKDLKISFDYDATKITNLSSLDETSREFSLKFVSNPQNGQPKQTTVHKVRLAMNGDYALKDLDKYGSIAFDGKVLKDDTKPDGKQFVETVIIG